MILVVVTLLLILLISQDITRDPENFLPASCSKTPTHIQPEWYFLFAYAILRAIPRKLGGVVALVLSVLLLYLLVSLPHSQSLYLKFTFKILIYLYFSVVFILTWLGRLPVEAPYTEIAQILTILYFSSLMGAVLLKLKFKP